MGCLWLSFVSNWLKFCTCGLNPFNILFQAIWPYSGHYHPTEENFMEFISFLKENHVDLSNVKVNILMFSDQHLQHWFSFKFFKPVLRNSRF